MTETPTPDAHDRRRQAQLTTAWLVGSALFGLTFPIVGWLLAEGSSRPNATRRC